MVTDVMRSSSYNTGTGLIQHGEHWYFLGELIAKAQGLQRRALQAKLDGDHPLAVRLYRELLPYLATYDETEEGSDLPRGLRAQLVQRAIELLEDTMHIQLSPTERNM